MLNGFCVSHGSPACITETSDEGKLFEAPQVTLVNHKREESFEKFIRNSPRFVSSKDSNGAFHNFK